jgi:hypothetical protein
VFSGDGNYHLSNVSKAVAMDEYRSTLLETLQAAVVKVQKEMNWQPKDQIRLVHATFKQFSRERCSRSARRVDQAKIRNDDGASPNLQQNPDWKRIPLPTDHLWGSAG